MTEENRQDAARKLYRNSETYSNIMTARISKGLNMTLLHPDGAEHDERFPHFKDMPPLKDR